MKYLDRQILKAIHERGEPSIAEICSAVNPPSFGTFFQALDRLEAGGYIQSRLVKGGKERCFREERLCRMTEHGLVEVNQ